MYYIHITTDNPTILRLTTTQALERILVTTHIPRLNFRTEVHHLTIYRSNITQPLITTLNHTKQRHLRNIVLTEHTTHSLEYHTLTVTAITIQHQAVLNLIHHGTPIHRTQTQEHLQYQIALLKRELVKKEAEVLRLKKLNERKGGDAQKR